MTAHPRVPPQKAPHPQVPHPRDLLAAEERRLAAWNDRVLDFFADHVLASRVMFDLALILPLLVLPMSTGVKVTLGVISGSWLQWWALHAMRRGDVAADAKRDAKADADHQSQGHIAVTSDRTLAVAEALAADMAETKAAVAEIRAALAVGKEGM